MAKYSNVVEYNVITNVDSSGIIKLQNELTKLKQSLKFEKFDMLGFDQSKIDQSIKKVNQLQTALTAAFNPKIGTLDLSKLNSSLQREHTNLQMIVKDWEQMGTRGKMAISSLSNALLSMNKNAVTINTTLSKIANTFSNTVRWGITAGIFQEMMSSVQGAISYMKDLDESLTQIQMVTNSSKEDMRELAQYANNAAQALGSTTTDYTNAVKVFVQEGFSEKESKQYANLSTKLANISEQNTATTSDQITAYRNAFQLDYKETVAAMDKVANVANNTASNVNELMTASQRAASVAQAVGSSQDSFLAAIATIESVTRQSAEEIGNGLKTIYQRFADIKVSGKTEDGVDYGQYAKALKQIGVDVLDAQGEFKGMDQILKETQEVWSSLSETMKVAVGEKVAGKFQYNRFAALMNNQAYYEKSYAATQNASGMTDQMNEYHMEGIKGRLNTLQAAGEQVMSTLFDQDTIEPILEDVTNIVNGFNDLVDAAGGLTGVLQVLSALMLRTFSSQIASTITNVATSFQVMMANSRNAGQMSTAVNLFGLNNLSQSQKEGSLTAKLTTGVANKYDSLSVSTREKLAELSAQLLELEEQRVGILKEEENFFVKINSAAADETTLIKQTLQEYDKQIGLLQQKEKRQTATVKEIEEVLPKLRQERQELLKRNKIYQDIQNKSSKYIKQLAEGRELTQQQVEAVERWQQQAKKLNIDIKELTELLEKAGIASNNLKQGNRMVEDTIKTTDLEAKINSISKGLSSVTSIAFGFSMIGEAIKTCTDETATFEEKLNSIILNGAMGLTMILPVIASVIKGVRELTVAYILETAAIMARNEEEAKGIAIKMIDIQTTFKAILAKIRDTAVTVANTMAKIANKIATLAMSHPIAALAVGVTALTVAILANVKAWYDNNSAIALASKEYDKQSKLLTETKRNYKDVQDNIEKLKQSLDSISKSTTSLGDLTKGTHEWKEAVRKLNQEVLELLQMYPELAKYVNNEDGVLTVDQAGMDKFYQEQIDKASHLNDINNAQQVRTLNAKNDLAVAEFVTKYEYTGISKYEIEEAINKGAYSLENQSAELNIAFAQLQDTIQANNAVISTLNDNTGILSNNFANYATNKDVNVNSAKSDFYKKFGQNGIDYKSLGNNAEFLEVASRAVGQQVIGTDVSNDGVKLKYANGEESEKYESGQLTELLAVSEASLEAANEKLKENIEIYSAYGAKYDSTSNQFIDINGKVITSLKDLQISSDELAAIDAYRNGIYTKVVGKEDQFDGSITRFVQAIRLGSENVEGFSQKLSAFNLQNKEDSISNRLTDLAQMQNFKRTSTGTAMPFGINQNIEYKDTFKLSKEEAQEVMSDMMKKLNESSLSDEDKLQLLDKINWNMPVEDILANIQHAIETGSIESAFVDTTGFEDDSERKSKVLEDYDISESTLNTYTEQLRTTVALAEQHEKLVNSLEHAREQFGEESDEVKNAHKALSAFNDESEDIAVDLVQTQKGLEALSDGMSKYGDILKKGDKTTLEYAEALGTVKKALADTLNVSEESISNSLIESHLQDIEALAAGDEEALNRLRTAAGQDIILGFYMSGDSTLTREHMEYLQQKAIELNSLDIEVAANLNDQDFIDTLDEMLWNGELTRDQVNEYLRGIGYEPEFHTEKKEVTLFDTPGFDIPLTVPFFGTIPFHMEKMSVPGYVEVPQLGNSHSSSNSGPSSGSPLRRTASPTAPSGRTGISPNYVNNTYKPDKDNNKDSSEKQSKNNQKKEKETSEWDYLTDITNDLDRAAAAMEKLAKLEDRLFGANRVSQLRKLQSEYKNYIKLLQQEVKLAQQHAETLRTQAYDENGNLTMNGYAYRAGVGQLQFDAQGNLDNGRQIEQALLKRMNDAIDEYNEHRNDEDSGQYEWNVNQTKSDYDGFMKAMSEYESTLGKIEDSQSAIQDYKEKIQDAADSIIDAIQENLDNVIDAINDRRDFNRTYRNWQEGGNSYSHFNNDRNYYIEGLQGLLSSRENGESVFDLQLNSLKDRIKDAENIFDNDSNNADDEKLSEQAAFENLKESTNSIMETLNQMIDYYDSILETVQEASDKMDELIDSRLKSFDNIEKRLGTRLDQIKLLFGDRSYEEQAQIYQQEVATNMAKLETIADAIKAKQATVDSLEKLEEKNKELSTEERQALQDAREKITELQEEQLDTETKTLQAIRNQKEMTITAEVNNMVQEMFNGADIDWLSQQWELASRNSEKYLDDYNRAFEIQKLELKFQEALNDNQHASLITQQKINDLANEYLTYLREKEHLSDYDVKHAQMQLDILQKQIALEDARNNKSQMRLQRNAAGNYDFVYGANEDEVNKATEALLQAQQDSYNLSKQMYLDTYEAAFEAAMKVRDMVVEVAMDASLNTEQQVERIHYILENLNEYMQGSSVELGEISINLYNSFVEASQAVAEINQGALSDIFDQMEQRAIAAQETINGTTEAINSQFISFSENANTQVTGIYDNIISVVGQIQDSIIGEDGGSLLNIKNGIKEFEEGFTGKEGTLDKIKVGTDTTLTDIHTKIISPVLEKIDSRFDLTGKNTLDDVKGIETAVQSTSIKITGTTTKNLEDIDKDVKDTLISINGYIEDTSGNVETFLNGNLTRVKNSGKIVKDVYNEVDKHLKEKFENSSNYLQRFQEDTENACSAAEDDFNTFTEDAVKEANRELKNVRGETQNWRIDLDKLNKIIDNGRNAMDKWKTKIDEAWQRADNFTNRSFSLQERLANIGGLTAYSVDRFGEIRDIAPETGYAIETMANSISNGYYGLQQAASMARDAYNDMAQAAQIAKGYANDAEYAIDDARWASDNLSSTGVDNLNYTIGRIKDAIYSIFSMRDTLYENPWVWGQDEYGQGVWAYYDTGGYTGKWFDKGIGTDDGKLAVLHQKELVLNASDTENMLSAVELVRDIMSNINQLPSIGKNIGQNTFSDNIEQRVEISATFPGVTEAIEIKQALEQIADNAYQVANRYKY